MDIMQNGNAANSMKLTRDAICDLVAHMPDRAEIDAEVVVWIFVQRPDGNYMAAAPIGCQWMEALTAIRAGRGMQPLVAEEDGR